MTWHDADFMVAALLASGLLTGGYRWIALRSGWLDIANHRSSHVGAVPRGAGVIFAAILVLPVGLQSQPPLQWLVCGALVAAVGWIDDRYGLGKRSRLLVYAVAVALPVIQWQLPWLALMVAALLWLWLLNLYNFMDGINGIAAVQALFVLGAALALDATGAVSASWYWLSIALLAGYLPWNFPRARVFMGDAGSAFLGYWLGGLALLAMQANALLGVVWLILLGVFVVDASWTLAIRIITRQPWHSPHRSHLYQILSRRLQSHTRVVALQIAFNLVWLFPCALAVQMQWLPASVGVVVAFAPLLAACILACRAHWVTCLA